MILFVSGRTDIVAFYTPWFINRYKEGYVDVRNPFYPSLVSRIYFDDEESGGKAVELTEVKRIMNDFKTVLADGGNYTVTLKATAK